MKTNYITVGNWAVNPKTNQIKNHDTGEIVDLKPSETGPLTHYVRKFGQWLMNISEGRR